MKHKNKNCLSALLFFRLSVKRSYGSFRVAHVTRASLRLVMSRVSCLPGRIAVSRRLKQAAIVIVLIFAAAQLVRPERTNQATGAGRTIQAHMGMPSGLAPVLDRACSHCRSNATVCPRYTEIAPTSWLMAQIEAGVAEIDQYTFHLRGLGRAS